jgi:hypothetical protein
LSKHDTWHALHSTIFKTIEYPMVATTLTDKDWEYVMAPILMAGLPKAGIPRTFPRSVLYGPTERQGFGIVHPWHRQGILHLQTCLSHATRPTITGQLIRASMEQARLELGLPGMLTDHSYQYVGRLLTDCWLKSVWCFCDQAGISFRDSLQPLRLRRHHDQFLIQAFSNSGFRSGDLRILNECRLYLRIVTLSDICTVDGTRILEEFFRGIIPTHHRSEFLWPRSPPALPPNHWALWKRALLQSFMNPARPHHLFLRRHLGSWTNEAPNWPWFYSPSHDRLFHREYATDPWSEFSRIGRNRRRELFLRIDMVSPQLPHDVLLASVQSVRLTAQLLAVATRAPPSCEDTLPTRRSFTDTLTHLPISDRWAIAEHSHPDDGYSFAQALRDHAAIAVSDGSFKDFRGTSAALLTSFEDDSPCIYAVNHVPGEPQQQSSYRSELAGIGCILTLLQAICSSHSITTGGVTIGLDGLQALKASSGRWPLHPAKPDFDMLSVIRHKLQVLPITVSWRWIEGHQDDRHDTLDRWARLNIKADTLAKAYWNFCAVSNMPVRSLPLADEGWSVWNGPTKHTSIPIRQLYLHTFGTITEDYWASKRSNPLPIHVFPLIDWENCADAIRSLPFGRLRWLMKHATGFSSVGAMAYLRGDQPDNLCPLCQTEVETAVHVIHCQDPRATSQWEQSLRRLHDKLLSLGTEPNITTAILHYLRSWYNSSAPSLRIDPTALPLLAQAIEDQNQIGWYNFILGRLSLSWADCQQRFLQSLGRRSTSRRWVIALIRQLWEVAWDMWSNRIGIIHRSDFHRQLQEMLQLDTEIRHHFRTSRTLVNPADERRLFSSLRRTLRLPRLAKLQWLDSVREAQFFHERPDRYQIHAPDPALQQQRQLLRAWLIPVRPPSP